jgi:DNA-binding response OmpR family regulator
MTDIDAPTISPSDILENTSVSAVRLVEPSPCILSVSELQRDHTALLRIVDDTHWWVETANTCREALQKVPHIGALAIFVDSVLPDGNWKDVLALAITLEEPPLLVVTSRLADDTLWSEVLNLGGYDVLIKPLVKEEVRRVLASIWTHRFRSPGQVLPAAS